MTKNNFFSKSIQQLVFVATFLIGNIAQAQWTQTSQANIYSPASGTLSGLGDFGEGTDNNGVEYIAYTQFISGIPSTNDFIRIKKLNPTTKEWESFGPTYASTIPARHPRIAFDANNDLYIAYIEITNGTNNKVIIRKYNSSTQNWENAFGTSENPLIGVNNSQILSNQNNAMDFDFSGLTPLVAMHTTSVSTPTVNIFTYNGSTWQSSLINSANYNGTYFDLAKNGNKVYFFYPNSTGNIQGVFYENGAWNVLAGTATFGSTFIPRFVTKFHNSDIYIGIYSYSNNNKFAKLFKYASNSYTDISSPNFSTVGNSLDAFHFDITPQGEVIAAYCNATTTPTFGYTALKYTSNAWSTLACENFAFGRNTMIQNARSINIKALSNTEYLINTVSSSSANIGLSFVYNPPAAPTLTSFSPASGPIGSTVTITGTNFLCASAVSFNGTAATSFTVNSATSITATVPTGATTGAIAVTTAGGTATSSSNYNVAGEIIAEYQFNNSLAASIGGFGVASFGSTAATLNATTICTDAISSTANSLKIPNISSLNSAAFQVDLDFNVTSLPASTGTVFLLNTGQRAFSLSLNSSGSLSIYGKFSGSTATFSTQSTAGLITAGTNYKISVQVVANSIRVTLDNTLVLVHTLATGIDLSTKDFTLGDHLAANAPLAMCIDNFRIINNPNQFAYAEQITFTPSVFSDFSTCVNATSNAQTFSVSGTNLFNDVVITSDLSSIIEMSLDGTSYASSLTLPMTAGTVNTTTVYIRFKGGSSAQSFTGTNARTLRISSGLSNTPIYRLSTSLSGTILALPTISGTNSITVGGTATLSATTTAAASSPWVSSNTAVATVNSSGVVTGIAGGTTTITYTNSGGCQATYTVTVSPPPTITSFTPTSGAIGSTVTFTGTNFTGATAVSFNGTAATTFSATNASTLTATVPTGATTGTIAVTTPGGTATSATSFTVVPVPTITSFTPTTATTGATVTLTGTNFTGATAVSFNGTAATSFTVVSATSITVTVPSGASTGTITVTTAGGTATSASSLTIPAVPPTITSFSPTSGAAGTQVTITGTGFDSSPSNNVILLDGMRCTVSSATSTSLSVIIPKGTTNNYFQVVNVTNKLSAISKLKFSTKSLTLGAQVVANSFYLNSPTSLSNISVTNVKNYSTADIDADGKLDILAMNNGYSLKIAATSSTPSSLTYTLNTITNSVLPVANAVRYAQLIDFNNDGLLDFMTTEPGTSSTGGWVNINSSTSGTPSFASRYSLTPSLSYNFLATDVITSDLNNDGKIDILGGYRTDQYFTFCKNNSSNGIFSEASTRGQGASQSNTVTAMIEGEFTGDSKVDFIVLHGGSVANVVTNNTTTGANSLSISVSSDINLSANLLKSSDLDNDGDLDLIGSNIGGTSLFVLTNNGTGTFTISTISIPSGVLRGVELGDLNEDGAVDIIYASSTGFYYVANTTSSSNNIIFNINNNVLLSNSVTNYGFKLVDLNEDDKFDILYSTGSALNILINKIGQIPTITTSSNLSAFTTCPNSASIAQRFKVSATNLAANISVAALTGYEFSLDSSNYSSTVSIPYGSGTLSDVSVHVRLSSSATGTPSGSISLSSTGATTQTVAVTGSVTTNQPFANALALNGSGKIQFGNQTAAAVSTNFTIEAWVNVPSSAWSLQTILSNSPAPNSSPGFKFCINDWSTSNGNLVLEGYNGSSGGAVVSSTPIAKNVWQHVAVVVNGSSITFYINGNIAGTSTRSFVSTSSYPLTIGSFSDNQYLFNGTLDEVRLWNVSKSQQDIQASMYGPLAGTETGLVAYFNFNQGTPGGTNTGIANLLDNGPNAFTGSLSEITRTGTAENFVQNSNVMAITGSVACVGSTVQLNHPQAGGTWSSVTTSVATINSSGLATCLTAGTSVISYTYTYNSCQFTDTYTMTVNATPVAPTVATTTFAYCQNASAPALTATAASNHTLRWYTVATGGTGSTTAITPVTSTAGTFTYYVAQVNASGCDGPRVAITVTVSPTSIAGTASAIATTFCPGNATTLSLTGNTGTIQWQSSLNNSTWTNITGETSSSYPTPNLNITTYFRAVVTSGGCTATNSNVLTITLPAAPYPYDRAVNFTNGGRLVKTTNTSLSLSNFSVEAWIYPTAFNYGGGIISKGDFVLRTLSSGRLSFMIEQSWNWEVMSSPNNALTLNKWQHVAATYNASSKQMKIYVDGTVVATYTRNQGFTPNYASGELNIGYYNGYGNDVSDRRFAGHIDEVKVWNAVRTDAEIFANYATQLAGNETGLVAYYKFDQGVGGGNNTAITSLSDLTSNVNHLTPTTMTMNGNTNNILQVGPAILTTPFICHNATATLTHTNSGGTWSSSDTTIISINTNSGLALGKVPGTATITYTFTDNGCTYSSTKLFTVNGLPTITANPDTISQNLCINGTATALSVSATGAGLTYQWYKNTTSSTTGGTLIAGAIGTSYLPLTTVAGNAYYYCVVSGTCSPTDTSTISGLIRVYAASVGGTISSSLASICDAGSATLTLSGSTGTIQWQRFATPIWIDVNGETGSTYTTQSITQTQLYRTIVTNGTCSSAMSGEFELKVFPSPASPSTTTTINYCQGATTSALTATALSGYVLQWYTTATGGTASTSAPTPTSTATGTTTYYVSQKAIPSAITVSNYSLGTNQNWTAMNVGTSFGQTFSVPQNTLLTSIQYGQLYISTNLIVSMKLYSSPGGTLIATANNQINAGQSFQNNFVFSFANLNIQLNANQTYYFEISGNVANNMYVYPKLDVITGSAYKDGVANNSYDLEFLLSGTNVVNPCESPRTAITVNVNAIPTITGVQNMTVGGSTLQLTGSGTPNANSPWTSSSTSTATISATGEVTAVAGGSTIITYTNADGCSISQSIIVVDCSQPLGNVLHFDGVNDYITTASNIPALNITADLTIETWIKFDQVHSDYVRLIGKGDANNRTYGLWLQTDGKLLFQINGTPTGLNFTSTTSLQPGIWYHIAAIRNGNSAKIFINGVEDATATTTVSPQTNTFPLTVGYGTIHNYLKGSLEDVRVWNIARTVSQIQQGMYNSIDGNETGLVAYYDFNQGIASGNNTTITTANDKSLNTLNATLTNFGKTGATSNFIGNTIVNFAVSGASIVCANSTSQFTHPRSGGTWSISNGASASINSSGLLTTLENENVTVSYTYTINGCSVTDSKSVSINTPAAPVVTTPVNLCQGVTATALTATASSGLNLLWYTAATGGTASNTAPIPTTTTIGATTYYVSQKATSGAFVIDNPSVYGYANYVSNIGQSFNVSSNVIVNSITLKEAFFDYSNANTVLKIYNGYGGALLATANSPYVNAYSGWNTGILFSFTNQNIILTSGQTYYFEIVSSSTMYPKYSNAYANGTGYINGGVISQDFAFKLDASINSNPCESPRTAIVVNVNAIPTITGVQNMTVGGATLQLTGSGTPNANTPWSSSNTAVATISATGEVTAVAGGTSVITYTTASGCSITTTVKVTDCAAPFGNALNFDGVNDYAVVDNVGNNSNLSFSGTSNFTIESWVKRENTNGIAMIFSKYNGGVAGNYWLGIDNTGKPIFSREASPWGVTATNTLPVNEWHHIAATYDGSQTKIYVDGVLNNTTSAPLSINHNISNIKVNIGAGLANNSPSYLFKGELDEIRVWNIARTATQIQQTYNATLQGNEAGLVAYYDFNHGIAGGNNTSVNTVVNTINIASNGTLTNFAKNGTISNFVASTIANFPINGPASICAYSSAQFTHQISGGTWSLASGAVATISNTGLITSSANENVTVSYTYTINGCSKTETKTVTIESPLISGLSSVGAGNTITLTASTTPASSNAWVSSNPAKATVSASGVVTGLATGTTIITFTNNNACTDTALITIVTGTTLAPTLTSPATNTTGATTLNIVYSLPEAPLAGSVTLTFTPVGGGTPIVWTMNNATSANFNYVVGTNPISSTVTAGVALGFTTYNVTLAYQDAFSNPPSSVTNLNIQTLAPPIISFVSSSYATVVNSTLTINTINTGGSMVTYSISPALPTGFTFNTTTGVITGSSTVAFTAINYTVTATNAAGTSTATVSIAITADTDGDGIPDIADADVNGDGVIDNGPDTDGDGIIDLYDNDIDGDGIPNNLDNDADGDGVPNSQDVCATIPNTAITAQPSTTNQVICPSATISPLTVTATGPGLSYQWYRNTTAATTGGVLLSGANSASYSPLNTVVGTAYYYVVVSGTCGTATSNVSGSILVTDVTLPTVVTQNRTIYLNASGQAAITAAQIDNGSTDNCSIATRTLNQTAFNCNNVGANTVTLTVTDVSGNIRTGNATVTVVDSIKPTVVTQNITVNLNASGQASITAAQINNGSSDNCGIASVTLNQTAFTCANTGANTVTLTVIDVNGNVKTKTATVTVVDNILPTVVTQNVIRYLNASGQATVTANDINNGSTDNCGIGTVALSQTAFTCAHVGVNTVTLSVTDTKGNTATGQATVTIIDNTPPTAIAQNINAYLNAGGAVTVTPSQVGGNSTDNCSIATMTLNNTTFNCNNLGANPVILTVVDPFNNVSTANAVITVVDSIKPLLTIPADITVNTNSGCGAFGFPIGTASATDNCSVISAITNNAPTFYPVGITNIVYSVTDGSGNTKTKIQKVTVIDNVIPIITAPASITTTLTAGCTKTGLNLGTPVTSDNCTIASVTNNAPTAFPVGTTTVTWTVTDASGNTATATQNVTVTDAINPTITAPANLTINANASCVAFGVNLGTPVIADNCTVASVSNNAPAVFPIGTTIVTWTVNDASGNSASTNQQVTVVDNTAPMIFAPAAITTAITSGCTLSSIALGTPITLDNCSVATISNNAPTTFPIGATTVTWTVTDAAGNSNTATQVVTIVDNTNPTIVAPASVTANLTTGCTTTGIVLGTPITADNCTVANVTNNAPATYSLGTTIVTWTVTDGAGNTATATQLVTISDNTNPTITAPAAIAINTTTGCTVTGLALGTPVTADNCTVASVTNNAPTSFPIGSTSVIWTVTDGSGNTATATQVVTVSDVTNPTITAPVAITVTTNSGCEASGIALGLPITADNCTVASVTNNAPATFPIGTTTVTWTVTDAAGNTSTATQTVTVIDNINPSIIAPSAVTFYVSSGCSVNGIVIGTPVTADNCTVASVTNNAPATFPIGSTTVTWTVTDGAGNSAVATQVIQVIDTIAPTALVNDVTIALGLNGTATVSSAMVDAGSFDNCGLESFVLSQSMFSCNDLGTNVVQVTITDSYGNSAIAFVKVTITPSGIDVDMDGIDDACDEFVNTQVVQVPSGFSPNGDKINDTFIIPALDQFTKVQLQVFNKYGHEVYVSSLYKNDWDGTSSFNGLELPDDTYFYILNTDGELRQGYVYINRIK